MSDEEYKKILSKKLNYYIEINQKTQKEVADALGINTTTLNSWCVGTSLPRMGKIQLLADYFGINKSDLLEDKDPSPYYVNEETKQIAQEIFENPDLRSLFDVAKDVPPERLRAHIEFMKSLKNQ